MLENLGPRNAHQEALGVEWSRLGMRAVLSLALFGMGVFILCHCASQVLALSLGRDLDFGVSNSVGNVKDCGDFMVLG